MKRIIEDTEATGLEGLLGERVTIFAANYIYTGILAGVNDRDIELSEAAIVYETGPFNEPAWKDAQELPNGLWFIRTDAIESYGILK